MRDAFARGENAMEYARCALGRNDNLSAATLIAYDLQAGAYVRHALSDPAGKQRWCAQLAGLVAPHLPVGGSVMEVGSGEATTLAGLLEALPHRPAAALGFDISWSRCAHGRGWLRQKAQQAELFVADLFHIRLADASVDVVYTSHSLELNGGREQAALQELLRMARRAVVLVEPLYELAGPEAGPSRLGAEPKGDRRGAGFHRRRPSPTRLLRESAESEWCRVHRQGGCGPARVALPAHSCTAGAFGKRPFVAGNRSGLSGARQHPAAVPQPRGTRLGLRLPHQLITCAHSSRRLDNVWSLFVNRYGFGSSATGGRRSI
ncbi:MAG: class I SAM-dependent methyltransferase [Gammaproteobacteria bacterium]|nr:class I SAM-dependent methyltransferase [Gammaproteobacteria bacterium]